MKTEIKTQLADEPAVYTSDHGEAFRFNDHVCIEMLMGVPDEKRTGRLVQVRKGKGAFGTDIYFIRLRDGSLATFENALMRHADDKRFVEAFYRSNGKSPPSIPPQPIEDSDSVTTEYSINNKFPETGFIIKQPKQPDSAKQSFAITITLAMSLEISAKLICANSHELKPETLFDRMNKINGMKIILNIRSILSKTSASPPVLRSSLTAEGGR